MLEKFAARIGGLVRKVKNVQTILLGCIIHYWLLLDQFVYLGICVDYPRAYDHKALGLLVSPYLLLDQGVILL
jgi:hypothetical protein